MLPPCFQHVIEREVLFSHLHPEVLAPILYVGAAQPINNGLSSRISFFLVVGNGHVEEFLLVVKAWLAFSAQVDVMKVWGVFLADAESLSQPEVDVVFFSIHED